MVSRIGATEVSVFRKCPSGRWCKGKGFCARSSSLLFLLQETALAITQSAARSPGINRKDFILLNYKEVSGSPKFFASFQRVKSPFGRPKTFFFVIFATNKEIFLTIFVFFLRDGFSIFLGVMLEFTLCMPSSQKEVRRVPGVEKTEVKILKQSFLVENLEKK